MCRTIESALSTSERDTPVSIHNIVIMATQADSFEFENDSEFSEPPSPPPNAQTYDDSDSESDMEFSSDESDDAADTSPAAPQSEAYKRIFRATAFLKKAEQDAAAAEHYVFGAKAAAMELAKMHAKKVAAVKGAATRLAAAKKAKMSASAGGGASSKTGSGETTNSTRHLVRPECASPKAAALAKVKSILAEAKTSDAASAPTAGVVDKKSKKKKE